MEEGKVSGKKTNSLGVQIEALKGHYESKPKKRILHPESLTG